MSQWKVLRRGPGIIPDQIALESHETKQLEKLRFDGIRSNHFLVSPEDGNERELGSHLVVTLGVNRGLVVVFINGERARRTGLNTFEGSIGGNGGPPSEGTGTPGTPGTPGIPTPVVLSIYYFGKPILKLGEDFFLKDSHKKAKSPGLLQYFRDRMVVCRHLYSLDHGFWASEKNFSRRVFMEIDLITLFHTHCGEEVGNTRFSKKSKAVAKELAADKTQKKLIQKVIRGSGVEPFNALSDLLNNLCVNRISNWPKARSNDYKVGELFGNHAATDLFLDVAQAIADAFARNLPSHLAKNPSNAETRKWLQAAILSFASGLSRVPSETRIGKTGKAVVNDLCNAEPNSNLFYLFSELGFRILKENVAGKTKEWWKALLPGFVIGSDLYTKTYGRDRVSDFSATAPQRMQAAIAEQLDPRPTKTELLMYQHQAHLLYPKSGSLQLDRCEQMWNTLLWSASAYQHQGAF